MIIIPIGFSMVFLVLGMFIDDKKEQQLMMLGLSSFFGIGGTYLAYHENEPYYAYIPLSFAIVAIIYSIYVIYIIISNRNDWGDEVDDGMNDDFIKGSGFS